MARGIFIPGLGIEPMFPALAGGFLTNEPPGQSSMDLNIVIHPGGPQRYFGVWFTTKK